MCTVSIIPLPGAGGYRLVTNRDEHRERAEALPPRWHTLPGCEPAFGPPSRAIWPTDATAGGTWVAAAEHGLTLTLLNLNLPPGDPGIPKRFVPASRGLVIPRLIGRRGPDDAAGALAAMDLREFLPFRLVAVGPGPSPERPRIFECRWDGVSVRVARHDGSPICFVSSGLGDRLAEPRLTLFEEMVVAAGATPQAQDEFHGHAWPGRLAVSVMMSRAEARTVSVCRVEARPGASPAALWAMAMDYLPVPESAPLAVAGQAGALR